MVLYVNFAGAEDAVSTDEGWNPIPSPAIAIGVFLCLVLLVIGLRYGRSHRRDLGSVGFLPVAALGSLVLAVLGAALETKFASGSRWIPTVAQLIGLALAVALSQIFIDRMLRDMRAEARANQRLADLKLRASGAWSVAANRKRYPGDEVDLFAVRVTEFLPEVPESIRLLQQSVVIDACCAQCGHIRYTETFSEEFNDIDGDEFEPLDFAYIPDLADIAPVTPPPANPDDMPGYDHRRVRSNQIFLSPLIRGSISPSLPTITVKSRLNDHANYVFWQAPKVWNYRRSNESPPGTPLSLKEVAELRNHRFDVEQFLAFQPPKQDRSTKAARRVIAIEGLHHPIGDAFWRSIRAPITDSWEFSIRSLPSLRVAQFFFAGNGGKLKVNVGEDKIIATAPDREAVLVPGDAMLWRVEWSGEPTSVGECTLCKG